MTLLVEYPPTANHMKVPIAIKMRSNGRDKWVGRMVLADKGKKYYRKIKQMFTGFTTLKPPYDVLIEVHVPDLRKRDLPNVEKASVDALDKAGVIVDDSHIANIEIQRFEPLRAGGVLVVRIREVEDVARRQADSIYFGDRQIDQTSLPFEDMEKDSRGSE